MCGIFSAIQVSRESRQLSAMVYRIANGMKLRIDKAGRIVGPKPLRDRLGFKPDTDLEALEQQEGVLLRRLEQRPSMVKADGLWVHRGSAEPGADWERILEDVREERIAPGIR
jgi:bifunctional DNA-binding transcriptional regulator/antitoxin component of YhaV-PrlF toxin-antitoxin module